jgi:hypothetical protein
MYAEKVVAAIKVKGRILREDGESVILPFGAEYSVLVKNLNSVRIQIKVAVDGKDATEGTRLIVAPNSSLELERFIKDGNLASGNRFKFIRRTKEIDDYRGIGADDGLVRVEAWREVVRPFVPTPYYYVPIQYLWGPRDPYITNGIYYRSADLATMSTTASNFSPARKSESAVASPSSEEGITVPGSVSEQHFYSISGFDLEPESMVLVLRLRGDVAGKVVEEPVTVNDKVTCETCGKSSDRGVDRFCARCGTALEIVAEKEKVSW